MSMCMWGGGREERGGYNRLTSKMIGNGEDFIHQIPYPNKDARIRNTVTAEILITGFQREARAQSVCFSIVPWLRTSAPPQDSRSVDPSRGQLLQFFMNHSEPLPVSKNLDPGDSGKTSNDILACLGWSGRAMVLCNILP